MARFLLMRHVRYESDSRLGRAVCAHMPVRRERSGVRNSNSGGGRHLLPVADGIFSVRSQKEPATENQKPPSSLHRVFDLTCKSVSINGRCSCVTAASGGRARVIPSFALRLNGWGSCVSLHWGIIRILYLKCMDFGPMSYGSTMLGSTIALGSMIRRSSD